MYLHSRYRAEKKGVARTDQHWDILPFYCTPSTRTSYPSTPFTSAYVPRFPTYPTSKKYDEPIGREHVLICRLRPQSLRGARRFWALSQQHPLSPRLAANFEWQRAPGSWRLLFVGQRHHARARRRPDPELLEPVPHDRGGGRALVLFFPARGRAFPADLPVRHASVRGELACLPSPQDVIIPHWVSIEQPVSSKAKNVDLSRL